MAEILDKEILKALSVDARREIVKMLSKRPYTASELSKALGKHVTTISEHLSMLEKAGLAKRKEGSNKWVYYVLTEKGERIFKPRIYSWVVILSLSAFSLFIGLTQVFYTYAREALQNEEALKMPAMGASAANNIVAYAPNNLLIGTILIALSVAGFSYAALKRRQIT